MTTVNGLGELNEFDHTVDTNGNVQVDFVWGNFPLQPNDARGMATLDYTLDNHVLADIGWSNYPLFIPNYSGDEDSQLEFVVPDLLRLTRSAAEALVESQNLNLFDISHNLTVSYLESLGTGGKTVRVSAYDTNNPQSGSYLNGLRVGDFVVVDNNEYDFGGEVKVTAINEDGENSWFEFKTSTNLELDTSADGTVYAGSNLVDIITVQRFWNASGSIKNPGTNIHVRYFEAAPVAPAALLGPSTNWFWNGMNGRFTFGDEHVLPQEIDGSAAMGYKLVITGGSWSGEYPLSNGALQVADGVTSNVDYVYVSINGGFPAGSSSVQGDIDGGLASVVAN